MTAITGLFKSKKAIVYLASVAVMAAIIFGVEPEHATEFVDKLVNLSMAYLGGQGLADLGKYAGEAYATGQKAIADRDRELSDWNDRVATAAGAAESARDTVEAAVDAAAAGDDAAAGDEAAAASDDG